jgi:hypothetical protein
MAGLVAFERAVIDQAPPGAVLVGASVSPDGKYGVALTYLPTANYLMDDVLVRTGDRWALHMGGSGGGLQWSRLGEEDRGVLRYEDEAPAGTSVALIKYEGRTHRVTVRNGYFLFVVWNASSLHEQPSSVGFEY